VRSYSRQKITTQDLEAVKKALKADILTGGKTNEEFEKEIKTYTKTKYAITFNNATSALVAAYFVAGLGKGDEFITSPISFVATANAGFLWGAKPVFCEVKPNGQIDEELIESKITAKTKAIVPVHYSGNLSEITKIKKIAKKYNLFMIEDAAHAFGSKLDDEFVGGFGDMSIFSFHPVKPLTTLEGGAVTTNNEDFYLRLKNFRSHGVLKQDLWKQDMRGFGLNFRLNDVSAALGLSQLKRLESFISQREEVALFYDEKIAKIDELSSIVLPKNIRSTRHLYPVLLAEKLLPKKEKLFATLQKKGLGVQVHYKPINQMSFYKNQGFGQTKSANDFYKKELSIPCHQNLTLKDAKKVIKILKEAILAV